MSGELDFKLLMDLADLKVNAPDLYKKKMDALESVLVDYAQITVKLMTELQKAME